jgi:hypothetical protein
MSLHEKILAVMTEVEYLNKDDTVGSGKNEYKGISEEKVTETVRKSLIKNKLVLFPIEQIQSRTDTVLKDSYGNEKVNRLTTVETKYKIVDVETGEFEILASSGQGADTQDKGIGKAMTYSYKYLLLRTFAIPTGEDPDKVSSLDYDKQFEQKNANKQPQQPQPDKQPQQPQKISEPQAKRLFALAKGNLDIVKLIITKYKYENTKDITTADYKNISSEIEFESNKITKYKYENTKDITTADYKNISSEIEFESNKAS